MAEWQFIEGDEFLDVAETSDENSAAWRWLLLGLIIAAMLTGAGYWLLKTQRLTGRTALRANLTAVMFEEASRQANGEADQADAFMMSTAPTNWREAYRQTFVDPASQVNHTELKEIDFDGRCAVVRVLAAGHEQLRAYCLEGDRWHRAPLAPDVWGESQRVEITPNWQLIFPERDQAFGQRLAGDLKRFAAKLAAWAIDPAAAAPPLTISLDPVDLGPPLIAVEPGRISINSPKVVLVPGPEPAESAIRLALFEALVAGSPAFQAATESSLPGAAHFLKASQTMMARQAAFSAGDLTGQVAGWVEQLDDHWISPFLVTNNWDYNQRAAITAQISVAHLLRREGAATVGRIVQQLPQQPGWDQLFEAELGRSTAELEAEIVAHLPAGERDGLIQIPLTSPSLTPTLPPETTLISIAEGLAGGKRAFVAWPGRINPLILEIPAGIPSHTSDEISLPAGCILPDSTLAVTGTWLEAPHRFQASSLTIQQIAALVIRTAPADTLAYLLEGEVSAEPRTELNEVLLSSQLSSGPSSLPPSRWLLAVRPNGALRPLAVLAENTRFYTLPTAPNAPLRFLFTLDLPTCARSWFIVYDPQQGIVGQWLAPPDPVQWLWRPDHQDIFFFEPREAGRGFDIYKTGDSLALEPVSRTFAPFVFLGWSRELASPINVLDWFDTTYIGVSDLATGGLDRVYSYFKPFRAPQLSPEGAWLAYLAGSDEPALPATRLGLLHLPAKKDTTIFQVEAGQGIAFPTWSTHLDQPVLAALTGPIGPEGKLQPNQLLIIAPEQADQVTVVAQVAGGAQLGTPIFCSNGALLYRLQRGEAYELIYQSPGLRARPLLTERHLFRPVACP